MKPVIFLRPAEAEMLDAAQYYELQRRDLAWISWQGLKPQSRISVGTPRYGQLFRQTPVVA